MLAEISICTSLAMQQTLTPSTLNFLTPLLSAQSFEEVVSGLLELALNLTTAHGARFLMPLPGGDLSEMMSRGRGFVLFDTVEAAQAAFILREAQIGRDYAHLPLGQGEVWGVLELIFPEHDSLEALQALSGLVGFALEATFRREQGQSHLSRDRLLTELAHALGGRLELGGVLSTLTAFTAAALNLERSFIGLFEKLEPEGATTGELHTYGFGEVLKGRPLRLSSETHRKLIRQGEVLLVRGPRDHQGSLARHMAAHGMHACLVVGLFAGGLRTGGKPLGLLYADTTDKGAVLKGSDLERALWLAEGVSVALERTLMYAQESRKRRAAEGLRELSSTLSSTLHLGEILESLLEHSLSLFTASAVAVFELANDGETLRIRSSVGLETEYILRTQSKVGLGTLGRAIFEGRPVLRPDVLGDFQSNPENFLRDGFTRELLEAGRYPFRGHVGIPLSSRGKTFGGILLYFEDAIDELREEDLDLLEVFAGQAALAIENARLFEELQEQEAQYRILAESAQDLIVTTDTKGLITYINPAIESVLGFSPLEMVGRFVKDFLEESDFKAAFRAWRDCLRSKGQGAYFEGQIKARDGSSAFLEINLNALSRDGQVMGVLAVGRDLTEEHSLAEEIGARGQALRLSEERRLELRSYLALFTQAQEEERRRISRELHDDTAQVLIAVGRRLDRLAREMGEPKLVERVSSIREDVDAALVSVRRFSHNLRPSVLDDLGLMAALEQLAERSSPPARLEVAGTERRLSGEVELTLFRMVQEALGNVMKHAQASSVTVRLEFREAQTHVWVLDNGVGFDPSRLSELLLEGHLGLLGLRERVELLGGALEIVSEPGAGTEMHFFFPD